MPPCVTLGLAAHKTPPRSRAAEKNIDFVHTQDGRIYHPVSDATPNPPERQGRRVVGGQESGYRTLMPRGAGSHRHGASAGASRIAARITSQMSASGPLRLAPDAARWHECEPRLLAPA
jgi:hypothetical protein